MNLLDRLKWRYAAKAMNGQKVPQDKMDNIIEAISLAPTSSGLQPFEVFVITNQEVKDKIRPVAWNQSVVSDCSHLLVFAAWDTYTAERINKMFDLTNTVRGFKNEGWENYRQMLLNNYPQKDAEETFTHAVKQAYIAFSHAITAAAFEEVDGFQGVAVHLGHGLQEEVALLAGLDVVREHGGAGPLQRRQPRVGEVVTASRT